MIAASGVWAELRRRKVVQWGLAYAAGAWGFLQGLQYVSDAFAWPTQIRQVAILALLVGLPIVVVVAWFHGDRGEQRVTATELATITLLFLLGGGLFWRYAHTGRTSSTASVVTAVPRPAAATDQRPSIAVLPFDNRSANQDDAFFVDGIHDDILTQLTKIGAMRVIARTSVEQFRSTRLTTREIGEKLGVTRVLEGGVQRAGDHVRITVQLIDATTDAQLWAEHYDRQLTAANIFAIQSEVATAIAAAMKAAVTSAEAFRVNSVPTQNLDAWEAYQLGQQRMAKRASADIADAEQFFRKTIDLDPMFAPAYVGLAQSLVMQVTYSGAPRGPALSNAESAVAEALKVDPNLAEAWASAGLIANTREQYERAESMFRRSIELNPNYAPARQWYSIMLHEVGRPGESLAQIQQAAGLDPMSTAIKMVLGAALWEQGRLREAEAAFRKAITIDASRPTPYLALAKLNAYAFGHIAAAIPLVQKAMELDSDNPEASRELAFLYFELGDDTRFFDMTAQAAKRWPENADIQVLLALRDVLRLDTAGAVRNAQRAFDAEPRYDLALKILRDVDLQNGRYEAALARYEQAYPELFVPGAARVDGSNYRAAIDVALIAQKRGDSERAGVLLDGAARTIQTIPQRGGAGYGIADVQIHALRGKKAEALAALREAERTAWRNAWRYYRDFDLALASIRNEPEFKSVFADIERDMARQRAELAKRPEDAPLDIQSAR